MKGIDSRFQLLVAMFIVGLVMAQPESVSGQIYVDFKDGPIRTSDREVTVGSIAKVEGSPQQLVKEISAVVVDSFDGADALSIDQLKVAIRVSLAGYQNEQILFKRPSIAQVVLIKQRDQRAEFEQAFARYLTSQYFIPNSDVKVSLDPKTSLPGNVVDFSSMTVNDVLSPEFPLGNHKYSISTLSDSGASVSFDVNVQTVMYRKLAVAKRIIPQGTKITRDHVSGVLRPISSPRQVYLTVEQVLGSTVRIGVSQYGLVRPNDVHHVEEFLVPKNSSEDAVPGRRGFPVTLQNLRMASSGIQVGNGARPIGTTAVLAQEVSVETGVRTHMAIEGDGFFKVTMTKGKFGYTRDGSFVRNATGRMVNVDGRPLEPAITVPPTAEKIMISRTGLVSYEQDGAIIEVGNIPLFRFANPAGLRNIGGNLYLATEASGPEIAGMPGECGYGFLRQGALNDPRSKSNPKLTH
ncbi:MAG: hypothetical protein AAFN77_08720 [Planctomycetota bacterium]